MNNKQRKIILISLVIILVLLLAAIFIFSGRDKKKSEGISSDNFSVEFLSDKQKEFYGLEKETKAQAFYDEEGNLIYKIIKNEEDIVSDPVGAGLKADWK